MTVAGVVAEYNPFHPGHAFHLGETRRALGECAVVAVMSGNFVQRGECAVFDKWTRARAALEDGLTPDAVLSDVERAMNALGEVTGQTLREDLTARIFERFCVGK